MKFMIFFYIKRKEIILSTLFLIAGLFGTVLHAQVTIGSTNAPDRAKLLQIESIGGLGLPRVQLVNTATLQPFIALDNILWTSNQEATKKTHTGLMVYNLTTTDGFRPGIYVWDGTTWVEAGEGAGSGGKRWFYMPAFNLPMEQLGETAFDLYAEYKRQFTQSLNNEYRVSSSPVTTVPSPEIGTLYGKDELDYVVVYYDNTVVTVNNITAEGVISYDVLDTDPGALSFMTVIFVIKK